MNGIKNIKLGSLLMLILVIETFGQQYNFVHYNRSEDKIGNQVWDIYQDSKGYMWFATSAGVSRYNGWKYNVYTNEQGLLESFAFNVKEDKKGNLWIGSPVGVSKLILDNRNLSMPKVQNYVLGKFMDFYRVYIDSKDRIWVYNTVSPDDVYYIENDSLLNFSQNFYFHNKRILQINENKGAIYLLTKDGRIYKFFAGIINELKIKTFSKQIEPRSFFFNQKDELIICGSGGVGSISMDEFSHELKFYWVLRVPSMYALESKYGGYWIATEQNGLFRVKDNQVLHITEKNGLPTNNLYTLFEDREGTLWIGAALKGISKLPSLKFINFTKVEGFTQEGISSITIQNNKIYCTTENGIFVFQEPYFNKIKMITNEKLSSNSKFFFHMLYLRNGKWLLGGADGLYLLSENGMVELIGLKGLWIQTFFKDESNQVWIGTNKGLYKLRGERTIIAQDFEQKDLNINTILEVDSKDLYLGTTEGVYIIENGTIKGGSKTIKNLSTNDGLLSNLILDLANSSDGETLIGTAKGINVLSKKGNYKIDDELSTKYIIDLHQDKKGRFWAGTYNGLVRLEKRDGKFRVVKEYFQKDGLITNEFTRNNTIGEDNKGRIWIGTFGGLTVYNPVEDDDLIIKPPCFITSVKVNEIDYNFNQQDENEFSYTENKLSFSFEGLSFLDEQTIKYKYYLEPLEKEWANSSKIPVATYNNLVPGHYVFKVVAISPSGAKSELQTWSFTISPPFWRRWWFITFLIFSTGILLYVIHSYRTRKIRKRNEQLQKLVNEKTEELRITNEKLEKQNKYLLEAQKQLVDKAKLEEAFKEIEKLKNRLAVENIYLREKQNVVYEVGSIIGNSEITKKIRENILEVAPIDSTVLIMGETGTGKTIIAEAIHALSRRKDRTLISVNCAAIPDGLVESELFGHEKGAFTGAHTRRVGKFEVADGSTIFLDEIGDMGLHIQSKVLTFLQERKFSRVGGNDLISVDVRIIAATNFDLEKLVYEGKFRKDLYHRLQVYCIDVPPLRNRKEDIEPLTKFFADKFSKIMNKNIKAINKAAIEKLKNYHFPGNVRELENVIQRAIIVCKSEVISDEDIILSSTKNELYAEHDIIHTILTLEEMERNYILAVLRKTSGKIAGKGGAAELLGLHPNTLRSRMEKLKIPKNH